MAIGLVGVAWWYHSEKELERNRICCGGTANVNADSNVNTAVQTVSTCEAGCRQYGYEVGRCESVGSSFDSLQFQEANKASLISTIANMAVHVRDCDKGTEYSGTPVVGAWENCYCLKTNGALVTPTDTNSATNTNTAIDTTGWKTYSNTDYNYFIKYPANQFTEPDISAARVRIQNYSYLTDKIRLGTGEYYLEIFNDYTGACKEIITDSYLTTFGSKTGMRGNRIPGGDAGGLGVSGCVEFGDKKLVVQITGGDDDKKLVGEILDTLTFTK
ncbi:MAG: hypothetical protein WC544_00935 [Patescibacteria group bacterium]